MAVFFTSDTHFGDARRIRIDKRPFANIAEHDAGLIARWNAVVGPNDDVYHLGDFARIDDEAAVTKWLRALNGRKHLIVGNNDSPTVIENETWASVSSYAEIALDGYLLILCHYPFRSWHNSTKGAIDIHGHSHGKMKELPRQYERRSRCLRLSARDARGNSCESPAREKGHRKDSRKASEDAGQDNKKAGQIGKEAN